MNTFSFCVKTGCPQASFESLVEARQFPKPVHELTWNRIKSKNWVVGYQRGDVKRFRKSLGLNDTVSFIVAHYPQNKKDNLWLNINEIPNHHIVFSARTDQVGLFQGDFFIHRETTFIDPLNPIVKNQLRIRQ
jgi:hypothetical protein